MAEQIFPNQMWFITRRVMWREMRLRPSPKLNQIFNYVVAEVAADRNVLVSAMCVMSNHWHAVVGTEERNLPAFLQKVHSELARATNAAHGDFGALWDKKNKNYQPLDDDEAVLRAIGYTLANPVTPGGVKFARNWPGVRVAWPAKDRTCPRPRRFYRTEQEGGQMPATTVRRMSRPLGFVGVGDDELARRIKQACERAERRAAAKVARKGDSYRKRAEILRMSRYTRAVSRETRFQVRRRVHTTDPDKRARLLAEQREWDAQYHDALARWRAGDRDVVFPSGTYKMVVLHNAMMAPPP